MSNNGNSADDRNSEAFQFWTTRTLLLCLLVLALLYTLYFARTLLVPAVVAVLLTLLLGPLVTFFRTFYVPRVVSAVLLLALLSTPFSFLLIEIGEPMQRWAHLLPEFTSELSEQLDRIRDNISPDGGEVEEPEEDSSDNLFSRLFSGSAEVVQQVEEPDPAMERLTQGGISAAISILSTAPAFLAQLVSCLVLTLFLLVFGSNLFESAISLLPQISNKQRAQELVGSIEQALSRYIFTVSIINAGLGIATALTFTLMGIENAALWGVLVALMNFAPYLGTFISVAVLLMVGFSQFDVTLHAVIPASAFFVLNAIEAQFLTPTVLGVYMRINPLILIGWLIFWGWLWGFIGVLLAVPLLVCIKLAAKQLGAPDYLIRVIEIQGA